MSKYNLQKLGAWLIKTGLMEKPFCSMNQAEIESFCQQVHEATTEPPEYGTPYINKDGELRIPMNAPHKYRWWQGGQSIRETLEELGAPAEVMCWYLDQKQEGKSQ